MTNILELERKVELLTMRLNNLSNQVAQPEWVKLSVFANDSGMSPHAVRRLIKKAGDNPADSPLQSGKHYIAISSGHIRINPVLFRQAVGMVNNG
jgi:hypothetical protein